MSLKERISKSAEILECDEDYLLKTLGIQMNEKGLGLLDASTTTPEVLEKILTQKFPDKSLAVFAVIPILKGNKAVIDVEKEQDLVGDIDNCPLCQRELNKKICTNCKIDFKKLDNDVKRFVLFLLDRKMGKKIYGSNRDILLKAIKGGPKRLKAAFPDLYLKSQEK